MDSSLESKLWDIFQENWKELELSPDKGYVGDHITMLFAEFIARHGDEFLKALTE